MNMKATLLLYFLLLILLVATPCIALDQWDYKLAYETKPLINSPFFLMTAADLNKNGTKELIVTDFGRFGDHIEEWKQWRESPASTYNLFVLEWESGDLKTKWHKKWDMTKTHSNMESHKYFLAFEARQMVAWRIEDRNMVETIPPYLGLEWVNGKYVLHEQQGPFNTGPLVGSWVFPWITPSCYESFPNTMTWPRECLVGIRDFSGKTNPKIVSLLVDKGEGKKYKYTLRVKSLEKASVIEWEQKLSPKYSFGWEPPIDRLNRYAVDSFLLFDGVANLTYKFSPSDKGSYQLRPLKTTDDLVGLERFDLPDVYLRKTQEKDTEEYWGYRISKASDREGIYLLQKVILKPDLTGFHRENINFEHHKSFLGVGFFDLQDLDGDGLDEIVLVEETGKRKFEEEDVTYSDVKDYIRILKWDGKQYQTMWVGPPYTKRGTKFLIEDIKNAGKKQLVVMTPYGTVQIWEGK